MKSEIREVVLPETFKPYSLVITVESAEEERILAEIYNHNSSIANLISKYSPIKINLVNPDLHTNPQSSYVEEVEAVSVIKTIFKSVYKKVYK